MSGLSHLCLRQETQKSGESITEFCTRLQLLARKCQFADPELEIKRQIIQGTSSLRLRRKAIEQSLNLENLLKVARAMKTADEQTTEMEKQQSNAVGYGRNKETDVQQKENSRGLPKSGLGNNRSGLCGGNYPRQGTCPAQGKKCLNRGISRKFVSANPITSPNLRTRGNRQKVNTTPGLQMLKSLRVVKCHL